MKVGEMTSKGEGISNEGVTDGDDGVTDEIDEFRAFFENVSAGVEIFEFVGATIGDDSDDESMLEVDNDDGDCTTKVAAA
jgi:hypothetical protein